MQDGTLPDNNINMERPIAILVCRGIRVRKNNMEWDLYDWIRCVWPSQKIVVWIHDNNVDFPFGNPIRNLDIFQDKNVIMVCVSKLHSIKIQHLLSKQYKIGTNYKNMDTMFAYIYNALYDIPLVIETTKSKHVIYASSLSKGVLGVVDLFCRYQKKYTDTDTRLIICSPGYEYNDEWPNKLFDTIKHTKNIHFTGTVKKDTLFRLVSTACAILTPEFWETFGCMFAEACFLGTHVLVSSKSGAVTEIVGTDNVVDYSTVYALDRLYWMIQNPYENRAILPEEMYTDACLHKWNSLIQTPLQRISMEDESRSCWRICSCL
jgi:glycosyltransferase involved in cell wall biosynthesis